MMMMMMMMMMIIIIIIVLDWVMCFSHDYGVYISIYNITAEYYYIQLPVFMLYSVTVYNKRPLTVLTSQCHYYVVQNMLYLIQSERSG